MQVSRASSETHFRAFPAAFLAAALVILLSGCAEKKPAADAGTAKPVAAAPAVDRYDPAKMNFKTPPAVLTNERHSGPFASGSALSMDAAVKPLDPSPVKEIRLDTTHKIIEIAPGVKFSAWTFGDQVPGPIVQSLPKRNWFPA